MLSRLTDGPHTHAPTTPPHSTDRKKLLELCKKRKEREAARREQQAKASALKKNYTSHLLPGDPLLEVRAGPPAKYFPFARVSACVPCVYVFRCVCAFAVVFVDICG